MKIGEAARASGVNAKLIRHYESIGLVEKAARKSSGYRDYSERDVHTLAFVRRARGLGFSVKEIKKLVSFWRNRTRASKDVKALTLIHIRDLEQKIKDLESMRATLEALAQSCRGDNRPHCPIIETISNAKN